MIFPGSDLIFALAVILVTWLLLRLALTHEGMKRRFLDMPVARSLHTIAVPRIGGLAIWAGVGISAFHFGAHWDIVTLLCVFGLFAVSLRDDWRSLGAGTRLGAHALAAVALVVAHPGESIWMMALAVPGLVWFTNLFNFMDGADGLAGGMSCVGFGVFALVAFQAGAGWYGFPLVIAAASLGFLAFNLPPARVFLGDAGSIPIGFSAAALGWQGWVEAVWPVWFPVLLFFPFILDATWTLCARAFRGERVWQAHREHLYQRLVLSGWSHGRLLRWSYPAMLVCAGIALMLRTLPAPQQWAGFTGTCLCLTTIYFLLRRRLAAQ